LSQLELAIVVYREKHAVAAAKRILIWTLCLYDFVDVSDREFLLDYFC
jgi:hypothetical protein